MSRRKAVALFVAFGVLLVVWGAILWVEPVGLAW